VQEQAQIKQICFRGEHIGDIELKGGALDFGKMVRLVCQPTQRFAEKILIANPPKKRTFVFCA
jgi:hypothetical protein